MGRIIRVEQDFSANQVVPEISKLKLQIIQMITEDLEMGQSAKVLAIHLLAAKVDRKTGWCYATDDHLAETLGLSKATIKRARKLPEFLRYFEVESGKFKGNATEYVLTQSIQVEAAQFTPAAAKGVKKIPFESKGGQNCSQRGSKVSRKGGQKYPPNPVHKSSSNPDCAADATHMDFDFQDFVDRFIAAHPRPGSFKATEAELRKIVEAGADPKQLIAAARAYRAEAEGNEPRFVKMSENWLRDGRWKNHTDTGSKADEATVLANLAAAIKAGASWVASTTSANKAREMVAMGLVTEAECKAAGVL